MSGKRTTLFVAAALAALALSGCVSQGTPPPTVQAPSASSTASRTATAQASVEPSESAPPASTGPITSPKSGSAERKELLDAAREKLASKNTFFVHQIFVQGDRALADIESTKKDANGRIVVAFERSKGKWSAIGAVKYGSPAATAANTARALPSFSTALINKIDWNLAKSGSSKTSSAGNDQAGMLNDLQGAAKTWSDTSMGGRGAPYKVTLAKVAQDSNGVWWGHVTVQPTGDANNNYEALDYWAKFSGGSWQGNLQDPEPPAPSTFFPASVISKLGL